MKRRLSMELSVAVVILGLCLVLAFVAPAYFSRENLIDLFLANFPVLIIALGMTLVILTAEIDISVGSVFAICSVAAGAAAKLGLPLPIVGLIACLVGAALGALKVTKSTWEALKITECFCSFWSFRQGWSAR